jgi:hypothetical protein
MMPSGAAHTADLTAGDKPNFTGVANGLPGLQCRLG